MNNKDCKSCKHGIKSLFMAEIGSIDHQYEKHTTDCTKGHWKEIEEDQFTPDWNDKIREIAENCDDFFIESERNLTP